MAEAPRWRYARKVVPPIEKILGLLVVLVLAGLALFFVYDLRRTDQDRPFDVSQDLLTAAARSPEAIAASHLLPVGSAARRQGPPQVLSLQDLQAANSSLGEAVILYKAKHISTARYDAAAGQVTAFVLETDGPEWAFGLWSARRPAAAKTGTIGTNGQSWKTDSSAAFWAGKYYVEAQLDKAPATQAAPPTAAMDATGEKPAPADPLAAVLAELGRVHVFYGRPFPAEALLPEQGLRPESLRFEPREAVGLKGLQPAMLAEYDTGAKVAIVTFASPSQVQASLQTVLQAASDADPEGQAKPELDAQGRATLATANGETVLLQAADRYLIAATGVDAGVIAPLLDQAAKAAQPAQVVSGQAIGKPKQDNPLPALQGDITGPGETRSFNPDTLYEKIDGKAQLYLSYNFAELLFTSYTAGDISLDVYVYDMGQADNAFGIFKAEEGGEPEPAGVGRGGYFSGSSIFFWKGKYYVNVLASAGGGDSHEGMEGDAARPVALKLATAIAEQLRDTGQSLWAEEVLPKDARVASSFEFRKNDAFGLEFLKDVFSAQYKANDKELTLFVTRAASPEAAQEILKQYEAFTAKYGKILENSDMPGGKVLVAENTGTFDVVFARGNYFGGATAAEDREAAKTIVTQWLNGLTAAGGR